jgi:hypothetical protein
MSLNHLLFQLSEAEAKKPENDSAHKKIDALMAQRNALPDDGATTQNL